MSGIGTAGRQLERLFGGDGTISGLTEGELLHRFLSRRDEAAFEAIVARHGPTVMAVCRRMLTDASDVDDAFQATFLVLVRRAGSIRDRDRLGNWLYGVAHKTAARIRADARRRRERSAGGAEAMTAEPSDSGREFDDVAQVLHEEVRRLPEKYRAPVVLCDLEGHTHQEAAALLRWPIGSVKGRLARARDLLRSRLVRRGVTLGTTSVAAVLASEARAAAVPPALLASTVRAASALAAGEAIAAGLVSATAFTAAEGVTRTMLLRKTQFGLATLLTAGLVIGGGSAYSYQFGGIGSAGGNSGFTGTSAKSPSQEDPAEGSAGRENVSGAPAAGESGAPDENPAGEAGATVDALTTRRLEVAKEAMEAARAYFDQGQITIDRYLDICRRYHEAVRDTAKDRAARIQALKELVENYRRVVDRESARLKAGSGSLPNEREARLALIEAKLSLAAEESKADSNASAGNESNRRPAAGNAAGMMGAGMKGMGGGLGGMAGGYGGMGRAMGGMGGMGGATSPPVKDVVEDEEDQKRNEEITRALGRVVDLKLSGEVPLRELIDQVRAMTKSKEMPDGVPIYVDPTALQEAEKTLDTPVQFDLKGVRLKTSLRLVLRQVGLGYFIREGLIVVTSLDSDEYREHFGAGGGFQ